MAVNAGRAIAVAKTGGKAAKVIGALANPAIAGMATIIGMSLGAGLYALKKIKNRKTDKDKKQWQKMVAEAKKHGYDSPEAYLRDLNSKKDRKIVY